MASEFPFAKFGPACCAEPVGCWIFRVNEFTIPPVINIRRRWRAGFGVWDTEDPAPAGWFGSNNPVLNGDNQPIITRTTDSPNRAAYFAYVQSATGGLQDFRWLAYQRLQTSEIPTGSGIILSSHHLEGNSDPRSQIRRYWVIHHDRVGLIKQDYQGLVYTLDSEYSYFQPGSVLDIWTGGGKGVFDRITVNGETLIAYWQQETLQLPTPFQWIAGPVEIREPKDYTRWNFHEGDVGIEQINFTNDPVTVTHLGCYESAPWKEDCDRIVNDFGPYKTATQCTMTIDGLLVPEWNFTRSILLEPEDPRGRWNLEWEREIPLQILTLPNGDTRWYDFLQISWGYNDGYLLIIVGITYSGGSPVPRRAGVGMGLPFHRPVDDVGNTVVLDQFNCKYGPTYRLGKPLISDMPGGEPNTGEIYTGPHSYGNRLAWYVGDATITFTFGGGERFSVGEEFEEGFSGTRNLRASESNGTLVMEAEFFSSLPQHAYIYIRVEHYNAGGSLLDAAVGDATGHSVAYDRLVRFIVDRGEQNGQTGGHEYHVKINREFENFDADEPGRVRATIDLSEAAFTAGDYLLVRIDLNTVGYTSRPITYRTRRLDYQGA